MPIIAAIEADLLFIPRVKAACAAMTLDIPLFFIINIEISRYFKYK